MGRVVTALATVVGAVALLGSPVRAQVAEAEPCQVGPPLVSVVYRFVDEHDFTSEGEVWALDTGISTFRLYRTGATTFCAITTHTGTFTTFAGPSPGGTGTVPEGHTGRFSAQSVLRFEGTYAPALPTRGFVGTFDANCDRDECATPIQFGRKYLDVLGPPVQESYRAVYTSSCGVFVQTSEGSFGDIAC